MSNEIQWDGEERPDGLEDFLSSLPLAEGERLRPRVSAGGDPDTVWLGSAYGSGMDCAVRAPDGTWSIA